MNVSLIYYFSPFDLLLCSSARVLYCLSVKREALFFMSPMFCFSMLIEYPVGFLGQQNPDDASQAVNVL
jgi:hypothetical protein